MDRSLISRWMSRAAVGSIVACCLLSLAPAVLAAAPEKVSFVKQVAPLLVAKCGRCHIDDMKGELSMVSYQQLRKGTPDLDVIVPNKSVDSRLVQVLDAGAMPKDKKNPVTADELAMLRKWIDEGARFDGTQPATRLPILVSKNAPPAGATTTPQTTAREPAPGAATTKLAPARNPVERAQRNWRVALPDVAPTKLESKSFYLLGNVDQATLARVGETAEKQTAAMAKFFKAPADAPFAKGRVTLFVFGERVEYSEFSLMIEDRSLTPDARGHWRSDSAEMYGCILLAPEQEYSLDVMLAQQAASAFIANLSSETPPWFVDGVGRAYAARLNAKDPRVFRWQKRVGEMLAAGSKPQTFLNGNLSAEDTGAWAASFSKHLMASAPAFHALITALGKGQDFEEAVNASYRMPLKDLVSAWSAQIAR